MTAKKKPPAKPAPILAFKGFDKDLKCRGFQYEIGKTYKHDGAVKACESGFHSCENPLDVLSYYPLLGSRFCEVEVGGAIARHDDDSKIASAEITIKAEIKLPDYIKRAVDWVVESCKGSPNSASGDSSTAASSGDSSTAASSGNYSKAASSGYSSKAASSGDSSTAASSGYSSKAASSGDSSTAASSGNSSTAASSGNYSKAASSGDSSTAASSGNYSKAASSGDSTIAMAAGYGCTVKSGPNGAFAAAWHDGKRPRIAVGYVGENGIKPDTFYSLNGKGEFQEAA